MSFHFIGINHYNSVYIQFTPLAERKLNVLLSHPDSGFRKNDMGWDMSPYSMYQILMHTRKYDLPVIITENGTVKYVRVAASAIKKGLITKAPKRNWKKPEVEA